MAAGAALLPCQGDPDHAAVARHSVQRMRPMPCTPTPYGCWARVQVIVSTNCKSAGEALREIDVKDVIKTDFVLVSGDVVSNMDLGAAMRAHRARREKDKGAIMTLVRQLPSSAAASGRGTCQQWTSACIGCPRASCSSSLSASWL